MAPAGGRSWDIPLDCFVSESAEALHKEVSGLSTLPLAFGCLHASGKGRACMWPGSKQHLQSNILQVQVKTESYK